MADPVEAKYMRIQAHGRIIARCPGGRRDHPENRTENIHKKIEERTNICNIVMQARVQQNTASAFTMACIPVASDVGAAQVSSREGHQGCAWEWGHL